MKNIKTLVIVCLLLFNLNTISYSQTNDETDNIIYNTWSATLSGGSMLFYGDLRQYDFYPVTKKNSKNWLNLTNGLSEYSGGYGLAISRQLSPVFGVQGIMERGKLSGINTNMDAYFHADILSYGLNLKINFMPFFDPKLKLPKILIYGVTGIGLCDFKTREYKISTGTLLHSYGYGDYDSEKKAATEIVIPLGLGFKYKIDNRFDIGIKSVINFVNTDKLDAHVVSSSANDKYGYTAITLTYKIGKNEKSLEWDYPKKMNSADFKALLTALNNKTDSIGNKLNEVTNKVNDVEGKITQLQKDVTELKNPPKEADDDNDGVTNSKDLEPNTPQGNLVNFQGKTIPKAENITTNTTNTTVIETKTDAPLFSIFFAIGSTTINDLNKEKIATAAKMLLKDNAMNFKLLGFTDKTGNVSANKILSEKRAQAVRDMFINSYGIDKTRITIAGNGVSQLSNDDLNVNRRVDIIITSSTPITNATTTTTTPENIFYIIADTFKNLQGANEVFNSLKAKGYKNAQILEKNSDGIWRVSYNYYSTYEDAKKDLPGIQSINPAAWIHSTTK